MHDFHDELLTARASERILFNLRRRCISVNLAVDVRDIFFKYLDRKEGAKLPESIKFHTNYTRYATLKLQTQNISTLIQTTYFHNVNR